MPSPKLTACIVGAALFAAFVSAGSAKAAGGRTTLTVYSVAAPAQFLNPGGRGLFPGRSVPQRDGGSTRASGIDFNLYSSANLKTKVGAAAYTCRFNLDSDALCRASYDLGKSGILLGSGLVDFQKRSFALVITGGSATYLGARGQVAMTLVTSREQRLEFQLLD